MTRVGFSFQGNVKLLLEPSIFVEDNGKVKQTNQLILHRNFRREDRGFMGIYKTNF